MTISRTINDELAIINLDVSSLRYSLIAHYHRFELKVTDFIGIFVYMSFAFAGKQEITKNKEMAGKTHFDRLVIAAYRLPFKFSKTKTGNKAVQNSGGLVSAMLALSENMKMKLPGQGSKKIVWAGVADKLPEGVEVSKFENDFFELAPVILPTKINDLFYGGFSNDLIWPLFHYFSSFCVYKEEYFNANEVANEKFCDEIVKILQPGDFVWIHDYQLMLLPEMLRKRVPWVNIGFFLHIPFPSFETFRLLPRRWRESIIYGILGADLIGFHTNDYTQHFIKSVKRTTGYECHQNIIYTPNKLVRADAFPIGIDYNKFHDACSSKSVIAEKDKIRAYIKEHKLIFSVDRLDYSKGLLLKLKGYETFLEKYPEWKSKVVFNMVVIPSRDKIDKYKKLKKEIEGMIGRINGKYSTLSWQPIIYQYKSLSFSLLIALYDLSDVALITPVRDGMNLVAKEYVACQVDNIGVLILSEMAGAAAELNEALIINPVDSLETAEAIHTALEMERAEKLTRIRRMQKRLSTYNVSTWACDFFNQSNSIKEQQKIMNVKYINNEISNKITRDYHKAQKRILFLDYDGTLVSFVKYPELAVIDEHTLSIVKSLSSDSKNHIVIISGRNKEFLEKQFKNVDVTLVAEHGYFIRKNGQGWVSRFESGEEWKKSVKPILKEYVNRCNGTFIEEKTGSLAWHYRNADADFAQLRLFELRDDLADIIRLKTEFEILEGNKVLEIKSGRYDKGQAAKELLKYGKYDFILAAGDDKTDEFLFKALPKSSFTIRVGLSPSYAKYNVAQFSTLLELLKALSE